MFIGLFGQTERIQDVLDALTHVLLHHHRMNLAQVTPELELSRHHVAYLAAATVTTRIISVLVPADSVSEKVFGDMHSQETIFPAILFSGWFLWSVNFLLF